MRALAQPRVGQIRVGISDQLAELQVARERLCSEAKRVDDQCPPAGLLASISSSCIHFVSRGESANMMTLDATAAMAIWPNTLP